MEKKICAYIFAATFITLTGLVHGQPSPEATRSPSVQQIVEVDIEDAKNHEVVESGYNFALKEVTTKKRTPANIISKEGITTTSYVGPIIFLIALPIGLWIMVSRKFSKAQDEKKVDYFPKTHQFKPFKNTADNTPDDDDVDYPKAS